MALSPMRPTAWRAALPALLSAVLSVLLLVACAPMLPAPGASTDDLRRTWGAPSDTHPLAAGGTRLEYATGPFGRTTWMIDLDAAGRVQRARQVLSPESLFALPAGTLDRAALRRELGRPGEVRGVHGGGETWYWRFETTDCLWLAASISPQGLFTGGAVMPDPACDAKSDGFN